MSNGPLGWASICGVPRSLCPNQSPLYLIRILCPCCSRRSPPVGFVHQRAAAVGRQRILTSDGQLCAQSWLQFLRKLVVPRHQIWRSPQVSPNPKKWFSWERFLYLNERRPNFQFMFFWRFRAHLEDLISFSRIEITTISILYVFNMFIAYPRFSRSVQIDFDDLWHASFPRTSALHF